MQCAMWKAASCSNVKEFEKITSYVKELDVKANKWLSKVSPSIWSRSHFNTRNKCDILGNSLPK